MYSASILQMGIYIGFALKYKSLWIKISKVG